MIHIIIVAWFIIFWASKMILRMSSLDSRSCSLFHALLNLRKRRDETLLAYGFGCLLTKDAVDSNAISPPSELGTTWVEQTPCTNRCENQCCASFKYA